MGKYVTISVPADIKRLLEKAKGRDEEWGRFLLNLYAEAENLKSQKAFDELTNTLTDEELRTILESSRDYRKRFALR